MFVVLPSARLTMTRVWVPTVSVAGGLPPEARAARQVRWSASISALLDWAMTKA